MCCVAWFGGVVLVVVEVVGLLCLLFGFDLTWGVVVLVVVWFFELSFVICVCYSCVVGCLVLFVFCCRLRISFVLQLLWAL